MATRISNCEIVDPATGERFWGFVEYDGGTITTVGRAGPGLDETAGGRDVIDGRGHLLTPAFTDLYADFCEPGHEYREDLASGAAAAAAGGYGTVCIRPDTDPCLDGADTVRFVLEKARAAGKVEVLPLGALSFKFGGEAMSEIGEMADAGVRALCEGDRWIARTGFLRRALEYAGNFGLPVLLTSEDPGLVEGMAHEGLVATLKGLRATPATAEEIGIARHLALAELTGTHVHLLKVTSAAGVRLVRDAKVRGLPITASVAVLHLATNDHSVQEYDPNAKVWPPVRSEEDRKALVAALIDGTLDAVVSDHAPRGIEDKELEFDLAVPGASTIETVFPLLNRLVLAGELTLPVALRALTVGPQKVLGLKGGRIARGEPANLVLLDRGAEWQVTPESLLSRGKNTPLLGRTLVGRPILTVREGVVTYDRAR